MLRAHTVEQVRDAEGRRMAALPEGALMEQASYGLATAVLDLLEHAYGARVLLVVGSGDNGGDALFAGAALARRGCGVEAVLLAPDRAHPAGLAALRAAGGRVGDPERAHPPDLLIDGIVGIGASGGLRPDAIAVLERFAGVPVVAVDLPSGVDCDTGEVVGEAVRAELTVTFGTHKVCHLADPAAARCGAVHLVDLGLELPDAAVEALQADEVAALLPAPRADAHKYTRGVVGLRTGSRDYPGAAVLTTAGADTGLAGMVRYDGEVPDAVLAAHPEVVLGAGRVQAWVVGSGGGDDVAAALERCLADDVPVVVDAGALPGLSASGERLVLTPHAGEAALMLGVERAAVEGAPLPHARMLARRHGATVLLKGPRTVVAIPDGRARVNQTGTPWLGTAGAGDVLAGLVGDLLSAGLAP